LKAKVLIQTTAQGAGNGKYSLNVMFKLTFGVGMDLEEMVPFLSPEGTEQ
jgi:hypothetical protein